MGEKEKKDYNVHKGIRSGTVKKNSVVCSLTEIPMTWTQLAHFAGLACFAKIMCHVMFIKCNKHQLCDYMTIQPNIV